MNGGKTKKEKRLRTWIPNPLLMSENTTAAEAEEKRDAHIRGVVVTAFSSIVGVIAGAISWFVTSESFSVEITDEQTLLIVFFLVLVQRPVMPYLGKEEFGAKDWLYIGFMTVCFWYISWTIIMTG